MLLEMEEPELQAPPYVGPRSPLTAGDRVEVLNRFTGSWSSGFSVVDVLPGVGERHYRLRRLSDGAVLPCLFREEAVTLHR